MDDESLLDSLNAQAAWRGTVEHRLDRLEKKSRTHATTIFILILTSALTALLIYVAFSQIGQITKELYDLADWVDQFQQPVLNFMEAVTR